MHRSLNIPLWVRQQSEAVKEWIVLHSYQIHVFVFPHLGWFLLCLIKNHQDVEKTSSLHPSWCVVICIGGVSVMNAYLMDRHKIIWALDRERMNAIIDPPPGWGIICDSLSQLVVIPPLQRKQEDTFRKRNSLPFQSPSPGWAGAHLRRGLGGRLEPIHTN